MDQDIFLSYAREDLERVQPLVKAIEFQGYTVWKHDAELRPGDDWQREMERAISAAKCVVVVWSQASQTSE